MDNKQNTFIYKAVAYTVQFMRLAGLKCTFGETPNNLFSYTIIITDLTEDGEAFGTNLVIDSSVLEQHNVEDTEAGIEKFACMMTKAVGHGLFDEKCRRLLRHDEAEEAKKRLIVPGQ